MDKARRRARVARLTVLGFATAAMGLLLPMQASVAAVGDITEYGPLPTIPFSGACEVHYDQYGKLWVEQYVSSQFARYDPQTGQFEEFNTPMPLSVPGTGNMGPDGFLWSPEVTGNSLLKINTLTGAMQEIDLPWANALDTRPLGLPFHTGLGLSNDITAGPDGNMWFTLGGLDSIGTYNLTTGEFAKYAVPGELLGQAGALFGILHAGFGNTIVFSMAAQNQVGLFNIDTKQFTIYTMPTPASFPVGVNVDQNTGHIWVSEAAGMKLAEINPATGHITEYSLLSFGMILKLLLGGGILGSPLPSPGPIIQADDGNMYFLISFPVAVGLGNAIARIDPTTHQVTVWKTPSSFSSPCALSQEHHGEIWFSELEQNKIAKFQYA